MPRLIVSTVGTSLLTNGIEPALLPLMRRTANARAQDLTPADRGQLESLIEARRRRVAQAGIVEARRLSAELNGLLAVPDVLEGESFSPDDRHLLVASDTLQGRSCAEIVRDWIAARQGDAEILDVPDLRTDELAAFRVALSTLAERLSERVAGQKVLLNLTGGFKSVNAYLQALAMLQGWETVFLFESARELLRIPRLPVVWDVARALEPHLHLLRRLRAVQSLPLSELSSVPESLLFVLDNRGCLSEWGSALLDRACAELYRRRLHPPAVPELVFSERFEREARGLDPNDLARLNRQLDELARWVATDGRHNPKSLDVKKLAGVPTPPSTHQLDAWTGSGKRLFGHFEDGKFVIDRLGDHL
ncbi:MAG: putative CRISPR-associated protein [Geminicoccaceae bacterium]|nr:putative CRISPR-associated protein [Geminicoccaceae bacterium]MCS7269074.1 putative CRISPR-associated protein [Geminicoccaceae bacterium]MCX7630747.1 putative CRISPR-associated protein [Geminicoccaceae bacterium]MDW8125817.1 putative CRISPR-associated protein [Geminicoccaceae bacterium]MDW8342705.1 putative CRISPR-associated protein [Geminicoccaceae bacterium]